MSLEVIGPPRQGIPVEYHLSLIILREITPRIMNPGNYIGERLALAWTWYKLICNLDRNICEKHRSIPGNINEWNTDTLRHVAELLIDFASQHIKHTAKINPSAQIKELIDEREKILY